MTDRRDRDQPAQHQEVITPLCPRCDGITKPTMIFPSNDEKIVWYRCDKCQTEFRRTISSRPAMPLRS